MIVCVGCKNIEFGLLRKPHHLCDDCYEQVMALYEPRYLEWHISQYGFVAKGLALFKYLGIIRELIIDVKVAKCPFALQSLLYLWCSAVTMTQWLKPCHVITPVGSSLASRWRGGVDLAYHFALESRKPPAKLRLTPLVSRFRLRKQSFIASLARREAALDFQLKSYPHVFIDDTDLSTHIIIDDIVTSGQTICRTIKELNGQSDQLYKIAALAYAFSQDKTSI